jgi:hypothetical protein
MAKQTGIINLKDTIGDLSFYKTRDGHLAREKGGVDAERIKNDPAFERTRENGAEFGNAAKSGKLVRDAFRTLMMRSSDGRVTSRLTKLMSDIRTLDSTSARGERNVAVAIANPAAKELLKGFNFNNRAILGAVLYRPFEVVTSSGNINFKALIPNLHVAFPSGATHMAFTGAWAKVDFDNGFYTIEYNGTENLLIDATPSDLVLSPDNEPTGTGTSMFLLMIEFFQEVNGVQYSMNNGAYNALAIVDVA